jgi:hypothetical protein
MKSQEIFLNEYPLNFTLGTKLLSFCEWLSWSCRNISTVKMKNNCCCPWWLLTVTVSGFWDSGTSRFCDVQSTCASMVTMKTYSTSFRNSAFLQEEKLIWTRPHACNIKITRFPAVFSPRITLFVFTFFLRHALGRNTGWQNVWAMYVANYKTNCSFNAEYVVWK